MTNQRILKFVMALINDLELIELQVQHLNAALALSAEANWNQVLPDWKMMIEAGNALGVITSNGLLVATAITLPFGREFGWISMVLVTEARRNFGIATHLLNHCVESLESAGLIPMLDATLAGENVYKPLGFVPHYGIQRWEIENVETSSFIKEYSASGKIADRTIRRPIMNEILTLDESIFGGDRSAILRGIHARCYDVVCAPARGTGFLLGREGRNAFQIGPLCAETKDLSVEMLLKALCSLRGRVFIDVLDDKSVFIDLLQKIGFRSQRPFLRMAKARRKTFGKPGHTYAIAGPELG